MPNVKFDFSLWLPLIALVLGGIAHALSADEGRSVLEKVGLPPLPRKLLPWLALVFGVLAGMTNSMVLGMDVQQSLIGALAAMATSTFGLSTTRIAHDTIGGGGAEPPRVPAAALLIGALALVGSASACALFTPQNAQKLIDAGKIACVIEHAFVDDATLNSICNLVTADERAAAQDIAKAHREALGREMKGMHDAACSDAGAK